jgi:predicted dehydrogenase
MSTTRRQFLAAAAPLAGAAAQRTVSANDRIQLGAIGLGGRGTSDVHVALEHAGGAALVAVSDLYEGRRTRAREVFGKDLFVTPDYRELLARKDIDAVIVATPDHWHAQASIDAMHAGKDVYCEKPMVHAIEEGHAVIAAERNTGRIIQVGSQRVSSIIHQKAKDLIREGAIGKLNLIEAWRERPVDRDDLVFRNSIPLDASAATIDWDRFVAHTTQRPFDAQRFFWWHNYRDYGTGIPGDLFVHLFSGVHFVLDAEGPSRIMATGGTRYWNDGREIPDLMLGLADYGEGPHPSGFQFGAAREFRAGLGGDLGIPVRGRERHPAYSRRWRAAGPAQPSGGAGLQYRHLRGGHATGVSAGIPQEIPGAASHAGRHAPDACGGISGARGL